MHIDRILKNIDVSESSCWEWNKSCSSSGYGQLTENKKYWNTHVYAWCAVNGDIPKGMVVRHKCHNRRCCNPKHLDIGSNKQNYHDSYEKHVSADSKRRLSWSVNGVIYKTSREAVVKTGISMNSIIKYTKNGIFDQDAYERACYISRKRPKVPKIAGVAQW